MFNKQYFSGTYFAPTYFGLASISILLGGGKVTKARRKLTEAEIEGLRNIYGTEEILSEVEYQVAEHTIETPQGQEVLLSVSSLEAAEIQFDHVLKLTTEQRREVLEDTDDIGLILAIIESLED